jgi:hypothetical protein
VGSIPAGDVTEYRNPCGIIICAIALPYTSIDSNLPILGLRPPLRVVYVAPLPAASIPAGDAPFRAMHKMDAPRSDFRVRHDRAGTNKLIGRDGEAYDQ